MRSAAVHHRLLHPSKPGLPPQVDESFTCPTPTEAAPLPVHLSHTSRRYKSCNKPHENALNPH